MDNYNNSLIGLGYGFTILKISLFSISITVKVIYLDFLLRNILVTNVMLNSSNTTISVFLDLLFFLFCLELNVQCAS
jgi:hypothetical protein